MKPIVLAAALAALSTPAAFAQNTVKPASADASADSAAAVPDAVKTYVRSHAGDRSPYAGGEIRIGRTVDAGAVWRPIPDYPQYLYSNLAGQLVVIDKKTSKVVALY
jgi:hypothetical protein